MHGLYRFHLLDPIRFKHDLKVTVQQIGNNDIQLFERSDDVAAVAYWYSAEKASDLPAIAPQPERVPR